jgi:hypothetical protein
MPYLLAFTRLTMTLVFLLSFVGKIRSWSTFKSVIVNFRLLPSVLAPAAATVFISSELAVVILLSLGGNLLIWGFILSALLLLAFTIALASVLIRKIRTSCNCFGPDNKLVSPFDLGRNAGFIICAVIGGSTSNYSQDLAFVGWGLMCAAAATFVLVSLNLRDIVDIFH